MIKETGTGRYLSVASFRGLHSDVKPTNVDNGAEFLEIDTGDIYLFNEANHTWVKCAMYKPTDAQAEEYIGAWLDDHPEATTTVEDGAITTAKLADGAVTDAKLAQSGGVLEEVADLKSAVNQISPEIVVGNQLCDTAKGHSSTYFNGTAFVESGSYSCSDYIPVVSGKTVYASLNGSNENNIFNIVGLSASKEVVTTTANWTGHLAITDEIAFIVVNCSGSNRLSSLMVSYDNIMPYETYTESRLSVADVSQRTDENTDAINTISPIISGEQLFDISKAHEGTVFANGAFTESASYSCSDYVPVEAGKTIYASLNGTSANNIFNIVALDKNKNVLTTTSNWVGTLLLPTGTAFAVINCYGGTSVRTLMVSYTGYKPYEAYVVPYRETLQDVEAQFVKYPMSIFDSICGCGDSFTQGACVSSNGTTWNNRPWLKKITDKYGIGYLNCGVGGSTTRSWLTADNGLAKLLSEEAYDLYTLAWGINDMTLTTDYIGSVSDIKQDYTQNPDTFYGNYARIIEQIEAHAPNAKIVMFPIWLYYSAPYSVATEFNEAIENIADHYNIPFINIFDDWFFNGSDGYQMVSGHPSALAYAGMAQAVERLMSKCIEDNLNYFKYTSIG